MSIPWELDAEAFANEDDSQYATGAQPQADQYSPPRLVLRSDIVDPLKSRGHLDDLGRAICGFVVLLEPKAKELHGPARQALDDFVNAAMVCWFRLRREQDSITRSISEN